MQGHMFYKVGGEASAVREDRVDKDAHNQHKGRGKKRPRKSQEKGRKGWKGALAQDATLNVRSPN